MIHSSKSRSDSQELNISRIPQCIYVALDGRLPDTISGLFLKPLLILVVRYAEPRIKRREDDPVIAKRKQQVFHLYLHLLIQNRIAWHDSQG